MNPIVVVYYSRTGKTRAVAERLAEILGSDIEEIRETVSRSGPLGFIRAGRDAMAKKESTLATQHSTTGRQVIVLGMPVWGFNPPPAIRSYLKAADLKEPKVCGFATMDGSGADKTLEVVSSMVPGGLALRLGLKKPKPVSAKLELALKEWAGKIKELLPRG